MIEFPIDTDIEPVWSSEKMAREYLPTYLAQSSEREADLSAFLAGHGVSLSEEPADLERIADFFLDAITMDKLTGDIDHSWAKFIWDISLYLGNILIRDIPGTYWDTRDRGTSPYSLRPLSVYGIQPKNPKGLFHSFHEEALLIGRQKLAGGEEVKNWINLCLSFCKDTTLMR